MPSSAALVLSAVTAAANASVYIHCADAKLPGGPGGSGTIPYKMLKIGGDSCDYFEGTAGPCADETKSGPLKGQNECNGAYYWKTADGCLNVQLADGSHHYCCDTVSDLLQLY